MLPWKPAAILNTVDPVIFASLNFREFLILGLFTKFRIREFSFFCSSATIIIILPDRILPDLQYANWVGKFSEILFINGIF